MWYCWVAVLTTCTVIILLYTTCRQCAAAGGWSRGLRSHRAKSELDEGSLQQFGRRRAAGVRVSRDLWWQLPRRRLQRLLPTTRRRTRSLRMRTERHYCLSAWMAGKILYNRFILPVIYSELLNNLHNNYIPHAVMLLLFLCVFLCVFLHILYVLDSL